MQENKLIIVLCLNVITYYMMYYTLILLIYSNYILLYKFNVGLHNFFIHKISRLPISKNVSIAITARVVEKTQKFLLPKSASIMG